MKYFIDTEFVEGTQHTLFGKTKPTIDLISIGIVSEDHREYYAISKDFNLKEAWNRFEWKDWNSTHTEDKDRNLKQKVYWLRDNVLKPIFREMMIGSHAISLDTYDDQFTYKFFKKLLNEYGKTNKQIAEEIKDFVSLKASGSILAFTPNHNATYEDRIDEIKRNYPRYMPEFYGYYADYDWVVFCWLFGNMIDLPKGFPMYCIDLKQTLNTMCDNDLFNADKHGHTSFSLTGIKKHPKYPKQVNEHNALADARWNKKLFYFLN